MKINISWLIIIAIALALIAHESGAKTSVVSFIFITLLLVVILNDIILPIFKGELRAVKFLRLLLYTFSFYVLLTAFKEDVTQVFNHLIPADSYNEKLVFIIIGLLMAMAIYDLEEYLVNKRGLKRKNMIMGLSVFGGLIVAVYSFLGPEALKGTFYGYCAGQLTKTPNNLYALLTALGSLYLGVRKELETEKHEQEQK